MARVVPERVADRLIVALDVPTVAEAEAVVRALEGVVRVFKVGFWLCLAEGVDALYRLTTSGGRRLFLDAKLYDVPETVRQAVKAVAARGASFVTVHGDPAIMRAAVEAGQGTGLEVLAVTALTSLDDRGLQAMGYRLGARELVGLRARGAAAAGCGGIIASADDDPDALRKTAGGDLLVVTPGIRFAGGVAHDQKRVATPAAAIERGADYLVVGRPILGHAGFADMRAAAEAVVADMERGWAARAGRGRVGGGGD